MTALATRPNGKGQAGAQRPSTVTAFLQDDQSRQVIEQVLNGRLWPSNDLRVGEVDDAVQFLTDHESPDVLIVDVSSARNPATRVQLLSKLCASSSRIIGIGEINDVDLYRQVLDAGLVDYLIKPLTPESVERAFDAEPRQSGAAIASNKRLMAFVGARGGVGTTTIAVSTAWLLAHDYAQQTALVDLDLHFGTCSLSLDLLPGRGLREALEHPERIDTLFVARAMVKESDNLSILGGEESLHESAQLNGHGLEMLLAELQQNFDQIVIDLPRDILIAFPQLLNAIQKLVVVSDLSLPGVRDALRVLTLAKDSAPDLDVRMLVNQAGRSKFDGLPVGEFERGISAKIDWLVPFDAKAMGTANKQGRSVVDVARNSKMVRELRAMCEALSGAVQPKKRTILPFKKAS